MITFHFKGKEQSICDAFTPATEKNTKDFQDIQNEMHICDNLNFLKCNLERLKGKVKCVYLDPPYNTGKDFIYKDKRHKRGECKHSGWLAFMLPRLKLARELLREDGVIFVSIDDNEQANLKLLMDEVFGEENSLDRGCMVWINKGSTKGFNKIVKNHEYILAYSKDEKLVKSFYGENNKDNLQELEHYCFNKPSEKNPLSQIIFPAGLKIYGIENIEFSDYVGLEVKLKIVSGKMKFFNGVLDNDVILEGTFPYVNQIKQFFINSKQNIPTLDFKGQKWLEIFFNKNGLPRYRKARNTMIISSIVDEKNIPNYGANQIKDLFTNKDIFQFSKPKELIKHILQYFTIDKDIVLDFFAGSGTTGQAVMELNHEEIAKGKDGTRKFILVQWSEAIKEGKEAHKFCVENDLEPVISSITVERLRRAGEKYKGVDTNFIEYKYEKI